MSWIWGKLKSLRFKPPPPKAAATAQYTPESRQTRSHTRPAPRNSKTFAGLKGEDIRWKYSRILREREMKTRNESHSSIIRQFIFHLRLSRSEWERRIALGESSKMSLHNLSDKEESRQPHPNHCDHVREAKAAKKSRTKGARVKWVRTSSIRGGKRRELSERRRGQIKAKRWE